MSNARIEHGTDAAASASRAPGNRRMSHPTATQNASRLVPGVKRESA